MIDQGLWPDYSMWHTLFHSVDLDLVIDIIQHSNINFKPKCCFRVLSGKNANIPRPPLMVDFFTESHKYEFLSPCRGLIKEFKDTGESMMIACKKG